MFNAEACGAGRQRLRQSLRVFAHLRGFRSANPDIDTTPLATREHARRRKQRTVRPQRRTADQIAIEAIGLFQQRVGGKQTAERLPRQYGAGGVDGKAPFDEGTNLARQESKKITAATAVSGTPVTASALTRLNWTAEELVFVLERGKTETE